MEINESEDKIRKKMKKGKKDSRKRSTLVGVFKFFWTLTCSVSIILLYCYFGAIMFRYLETKNNKMIQNDSLSSNPGTVSSLQRTVLKLWNITDQFNVLYKENWTSLVAKEMELFTNEVVSSVKLGHYEDITPETLKLDKKDNSVAISKWSLQKSFLYSFSIITTTGSSMLNKPRTDEGKLASMIYMLLGVPLLLIYIIFTGKLLSASMGRLYINILCKRSSAASKSKDNLELRDGIDIAIEDDEMINLNKGRSNNYGGNTNSISRRRTANDVNAMATDHLLSSSSAGGGHLWNPTTYGMANGHIGSNVSTTMIDLSRDATLGPSSVDPSCGTCEYCLQEANLQVYGHHDANNLHCIQMTTPNHIHQTLSSSTADHNTIDRRYSQRPNENNVHGILKNKNNILVSMNEHSPTLNDEKDGNELEMLKPPLTLCLILLASYISFGVYLIKNNNNNQQTIISSSFAMIEMLLTSGMDSSLQSVILLNSSWRRLILVTIYLLFGYSLIGMTLISVQTRHFIEFVCNLWKRIFCLSFGAKDKEDDQKRRRRIAEDDNDIIGDFNDGVG